MKSELLQYSMNNEQNEWEEEVISAYEKAFFRYFIWESNASPVRDNEAINNAASRPLRISDCEKARREIVE